MVAFASNFKYDLEKKKPHLSVGLDHSNRGKRNYSIVLCNYRLYVK